MPYSPVGSHRLAQRGPHPPVGMFFIFFFSFTNYYYMSFVHSPAPANIPTAHNHLDMTANGGYANHHHPLCLNHHHLDYQCCSDPATTLSPLTTTLTAAMPTVTTLCL